MLFIRLNQGEWEHMYHAEGKCETLQNVDRKASK